MPGFVEQPLLALERKVPVDILATLSVDTSWNYLSGGKVKRCTSTLSAANNSTTWCVVQPLPVLPSID